MFINILHILNYDSSKHIKFNLAITFQVDRMILRQMYFYSWFHHYCSLGFNSCINEDLDEESINSSFPKIGEVENKLSCLRTVKFDFNCA